MEGWRDVWDVWDAEIVKFDEAPDSAVPPGWKCHLLVLLFTLIVLLLNIHCFRNFIQLTRKFVHKSI